MKKAKKKATAVVPVKSQDAQIAEMLSAQYGICEKTKDSFFRECVSFGAMLIDAEQLIGESKGGYGSEGGGIMAWLAEHCPEINYKTAMGYKAIGAKLSNMLGGGRIAIAALLGQTTIAKATGEVIDVPSEVIKKRDELFANIDSRRKLEQAYFAFMAENGGGKKKRQPRKVVAVAEGEGLSMSDSATVMWADAMRTFEENRAAFHSAARDLKPMVARKFLSELKMLVDALEKRIDGED